MEKRRLAGIGKVLMLASIILYAIFWIVGLIIWGPPVGLDILVPIYAGIFFGAVFSVGLVMFLFTKFRG